jgi:hypothetical protein
VGLRGKKEEKKRNVTKGLYKRENNRDEMDEDEDVGWGGVGTGKRHGWGYV